MKKILALFAAMAIMVSSFAAFPVLDKPSKKASEIMVPVGNSGQKISLLDLSRISTSQFEKLSGKNLHLPDKIGFKLAQRELRKSINSDGTVNSKKLEKVAKKLDGSGFNLGGFALGLLLGPIGVLIAYLIPGENKTSRIKWAWLGLLVAVVLWLVFVIL
jgi:hypothetical protein